MIQGGGTPNVSSSELDVFAAILQCEAYQDYDSMLAVATVIMNRVYSPLFPNTITEVIYAPGQFEPTWSGRLDTVLAQGPTALSKTRSTARGLLPLPTVTISFMPVRPTDRALM